MASCVFTFTGLLAPLFRSEEDHDIHYDEDDDEQDDTTNDGMVVSETQRSSSCFRVHPTVVTLQNEYLQQWIKTQQLSFSSTGSLFDDEIKSCPSSSSESTRSGDDGNKTTV